MENQTNKSIYLKLLDIQKKIKGLSKDKKSHNFEFVTGNKLLSFIKPLMDEQGLILKQEVINIENTRQDYQVYNKYEKVNKNKSEILTKVMMKFTWIDCETGETDVNMFGANGQNDWEKGLGSALTYAERYFLLKYFHIATDEDDIDNPERKKEQTQPQQQPMNRNTAIKEITTLYKKLQETGKSNENMDKFILEVQQKTDAEIINGLKLMRGRV